TGVGLDDGRGLVTSARQFRALLAEHPHILKVLIRQEYERLAADSDDALADDRATVEHRLAGLLLELALRRGGYEKDGAVTITLPLSPRELADWVDAPPEAVARHLTSWRQQGVIHSGERHVTVVDAAGLQLICGITAIGRAAPFRPASRPPRLI